MFRCPDRNCLLAIRKLPIRFLVTARKRKKNFGYISDRNQSTYIHCRRLRITHWINLFGSHTVRSSATAIGLLSICCQKENQIKVSLQEQINTVSESEESRRVAEYFSFLQPRDDAAQIYRYGHRSIRQGHQDLRIRSSGCRFVLVFLFWPIQKNQKPIQRTLIGTYKPTRKPAQYVVALYLYLYRFRSFPLKKVH